MVAVVLNASVYPRDELVALVRDFVDRRRPVAVVSASSELQVALRAVASEVSEPLLYDDQLRPMGVVQ